MTGLMSRRLKTTEMKLLLCKSLRVRNTSEEHLNARHDAAVHYLGLCYKAESGLGCVKGHRPACVDIGGQRQDKHWKGSITQYQTLEPCSHLGLKAFIIFSYY